LEQENIRKVIVEFYLNDSKVEFLEDFFSVKSFSLMYRNTLSKKIYTSVEDKLFEKIFNEQPVKDKIIEVPKALKKEVNKIVVVGFFETF